MNKLKENKDKYLYILSIIIVVLSYASERLVKIFVNPDKQLSIAFAIVCVVLMGAVLLISIKNESPFYGLLSVLIGYKMLPVNISFLASYSKEADLLYYIAGRVCVVLFVVLIIKFYSAQEKPRAIKPLPILTIMFCVPFFNGIIEKAGKHFTQSTGNMLTEYLIGFALYALANLIIILTAYYSNSESMKFTMCFEILAMSINVLRKASAIAVNAINSNHISKSFYCWIAVYIAIMVVAYVLNEKKKKQLQ